MTDLQASVGVAQMDKLPRFTAARKDNHKFYMNAFKQYEEYFILPQKSEHSDPSWFGFILTVKEEAPFSRNAIVQYLEKHQVATRMLFGGNLIKQPAYFNRKHMIISDLSNTDYIMNNSFWIGVYPGITNKMRSYVIDVVEQFTNQFK